MLNFKIIIEHLVNYLNAVTFETIIKKYIMKLSRKK